MIGTKLGRYHIVAKLGEGGMGSVWRADDTLLGRPVALKFLAPHLASSPEARARFLREARAASKLEHPGIAAVHDAGEADGRVFIAYQFVDGVTLAARLKGANGDADGTTVEVAPAKQPLALADLVQFASESAAALAHAHERGVLHRDITAGNIMLRHDGQPVIVDFGLARGRDDATLTRTGTTLGTAGYMSPEQWRSEPGDARSDLWSLGVVLYEAATGSQPFAGEPSEAVMYRVLNEEPAKPSKLRPDLPPEFERIVLRLLEKDPRDRIPSAAALVSALRAISTTPVGVEAVPEGESLLGRMRRRWRRLSRKRLGPAQVASLFVLLAIGGIAGFVAWQRLAPTRERVLAVLPMRNTSSDTEQTQYIAEALGSELTARLGAIGGFRVLPWETTSRFGAADQPLTRVARDLGADLLLVGRFAGEGERIDVSVELVEGGRGYQWWSERFRREERDLANLQSDIAEQIAARVLSGRDPSSAQRARHRIPTNPEAYRLFLQGAEAMQALDDATRRTAEPIFRTALEMDSTLAQAWVGLGAVLLNRYFEGDFGGLAGLFEAQRCFERALTLDPTSGPAIRGLARVYSETGPDQRVLALVDSLGPTIPSEIERELARGWACTFGGLPAEAVQAMDRVLELDPRNRGARFYRTFLLWWDGRWAESVEAGKSYLREFGEDADCYAYTGAALAAMARYDEANVFLERAVEMFGENGGAFAVAYQAGALHSAGKHAEARAVLARAIPVFEARLASAADNIRLRVDLLALYASAGDVQRFDKTWAEASRQLALGATVSPVDWPYIVFALTQAGELERGRSVLRSVGPVGAEGAILFTADTALERIWAGGATDAFLRTPEVIAYRAAIPELRARLRAEFPWAAARSSHAANARRPSAPAGGTH